MSTTRTLLRSVTRIHKLNRDTSAFGFVGDLETQIRECPTMQLVSSRLANRYPGANLRQIFQRYAAPGVFRPIDKLLADAVVHVFSEKGFAPTAS